MKLPRSKQNRKKLKKYEYSFSVATHLKQLTGTDLTTIPGVDASTALKIISEIGTDITRWPHPLNIFVRGLVCVLERASQVDVD